MVFRRTGSSIFPNKYIPVIQASASPVIQSYAKRSVLNRPFNQWMMGYAVAANFAYVPAPMMEMIEAFAGSWTQSRINELGNKILRELECKTNLNKVPLLRNLFLQLYLYVSGVLQIVSYAKAFDADLYLSGT
jgi:hypothetical protein